eukprot:CAMPEP_0181169348 /NCGR_PEP_ID=MMETSP1096-20121128/767_1 /TAXON_ID=156174 ORGANISM="Chrysochromulina ericina, Strain CCMP281" /NCGR_SAMPLE_ID=MMETSP1096 /ASSEMBLY_ACC=CAM_ASM_000453 /LENGTH=63 /DNA_ID=CAMNT_0023256801 /DNA_START=383 /DNA_END=574 /DNA_ORIENTATION=-
MSPAPSQGGAGMTLCVYGRSKTPVDDSLPRQTAAHPAWCHRIDMSPILSPEALATASPHLPAG